MQKYVIGNWKSHKSKESGMEWFRQFAASYRPRDNVRVIVAPSLLCLDRLAERLKEQDIRGVSLAAQDVSPFPRGSYTGAVAADLIKGVADYVIVGHSERRRYFHETTQDVINKVTEAADAGLTPIVCVEDDELLSRLRPLLDVDCKNLIVAYTPVDALNFNIPESPEKVEAAIERIRGFFPKWPVVYGGALNEENVAEYLAIPSLAGVFLGSSSLQAETFARICNKA